MCLVESPYDQIARRTTFSINNEVIIFCRTSSVCHIIVEDIRPTLSVHLGLWARLRHSISLWHTDFFLFQLSHSVLDLLLCLRSLSSRTTQFGPIFNCGTENLKLYSRILWHRQVNDCKVLTCSCWKNKKNPNKSWACTSELSSWYEAFVLCLVWHFFSSVQRTFLTFNINKPHFFFSNGIVINLKT